MFYNSIEQKGNNGIQGNPAHFFVVAVRRIGRFVVSASVYEVWEGLVDQHSKVKHNGFSQKLKSKTLTVKEWCDYLFDRMEIFKALENRISCSSLTSQPSRILCTVPKRSQLIADSLSLFTKQEDLLPTASQNATAIIKRIEYATEEEIEWYAFVHYGELWFGGAVHAKWIERLLKRNAAWHEAFFPDIDTKEMEQKKKFSQLHNTTATNKDKRLQTVTNWMRFGDYSSQIQLIEAYFSQLDTFVNAQPSTISSAIATCNEAMEGFIII
mgnify:CR=1 FL=1